MADGDAGAQRVLFCTLQQICRTNYLAEAACFPLAHGRLLFQKFAGLPPPALVALWLC
jgi:hypothetical protein